MRILGIDGALGGFSVAVIDGEQVTEAGSDRSDALEAGLGRVAAVLATAGLTLADLDRIAVGTGPGSFTGLRIAMSYAKGLALARRLPLAGVSSFDAVTPEEAPVDVLAVVVGRPGVISARLRDGGETRQASGPIAGVLATLLDGTSHESLAVAGLTEDVASALAERGIDVRALPRRAGTAARSIARIGRVVQAAASPHAVGPDYGELPAATVKAR